MSLAGIFAGIYVTGLQEQFKIFKILAVSFRYLNRCASNYQVKESGLLYFA